MRGRRVLIGLLCMLLTAAVSRADDASLGQLFHQSWGLRQGAPGSVVDIAQTTDGYLWLATAAGLYRFDGVRFERYQPRNGTLPRRVVRLQPDPKGGLWIAASPGGVVHLSADAMQQDGGSPADVSSLALDRTGALWAAARDGLHRFRDARWTSDPAAWTLPPGPIDALVSGPSGTVWVLSDGGLHRLRDDGTTFDRVRTIDPRFSGDLVGLMESPSGTVWISRVNGPSLALATKDGTALENPIVPVGSRRARFDSAGRLWIPGPQGVSRVSFDRERPTVETIAADAGLSADNVFVTMEDREGNVWVGTSAGLDLFRESALSRAPLSPGTHAIRIAAGAEGSLWTASQNRPLQQLKDGRVLSHAVPPPIWALTHDHNGTTWSWAGDRLWRIDRSGQSRSFSPPREIGADRAGSLAADKRGYVWIVFVSHGLWVFDGTRWSRPAAADRLPNGDPRLVFHDRQERLWVAVGANAVVLDVGGVQQFMVSDLRIGRIAAIADGSAGVWLAGDRGLTLVNGPTSRLITGIGEDSIGRITGLVEADDGSLWINADRGVVRVAREEIHKVLADASAVPAFRVFDYLDGVIGGAAPIPPQSAGRTADGRLWFVGFDNLVSIDPRAIRRNPLPPPVHIRSLASGPTSFPLTAGLKLPPRTTNVHIQYTALSLSMPERVRFRYRLDGADHGWQEAGTRREVFYTNLAPGTYRFTVIAANNDGVWNDRGATQTFVIPPAFHQTTAFTVAAGSFGLLAVAAVYRLQVRRVRAQMLKRIEERMDERERIARELHDTLLQGFQGLVLRFQAVATRMPPGDPNHALLEQALTRADGILVEGRDRVRGLRGAVQPTEDLGAALTRVGQDLARDTSARFSITEETPKPLHPIVGEEAYWIVREGLINAFTHGRGQQVAVEMTFGSRELRIRILDDGRGLDEQVMKAGGRAQHWGLPGMRERATRIGASLELWSRQGAGTAVELRVPAHLAYRGRPVASRGWWRPSWLKARYRAGH